MAFLAFLGLICVLVIGLFFPRTMLGMTVGILATYVLTAWLWFLWVPLICVGFILDLTATA